MAQFKEGKTQRVPPSLLCTYVLVDILHTTHTYLLHTILLQLTCGLHLCWFPSGGLSLASSPPPIPPGWIWCACRCHARWPSAPVETPCHAPKAPRNMMDRSSMYANRPNETGTIVYVCAATYVRISSFNAEKVCILLLRIRATILYYATGPYTLISMYIN